ncbi:MAG TPA: YHS domain-containing (seleno)protein [Thalassobaculum sp.]
MPICTTLTRAALLVVILGTGVALSSQDPGADGRSIPGPAEVSRQGAAGVNGIGINSADGLAIHGFDPVAYVDDYQAVRGKAEFEASWQGARWRFSSAGNQARFLKNPAAYAPQYGGFGAYSVAIGKAYDVDPTVFDVVDGRVYLHRNARVRELWQRNPAGYIAEADEIWRSGTLTAGP